MKKIKQGEYLWVEKYRPTCLEDLIIPQSYKDKLQKWIKEDGSIMNLILDSHTPGTGKTSLVHAIIHELSADVCWINASKDNGIDVIRNQVTEFCAVKSMWNAQKIVVLDEFDMSTPLNQGSLRGVIEEYTHVRFIMTANNSDNIIDAIRSRSIKWNFDEIMKTHSKEISKELYGRLKFICENENITYQDNDLQRLIVYLYPSMRDCIQELQNGSANGSFVLDTKMINENLTIQAIVDALKSKDYQKCRGLVSDLNNPKKFYVSLYKLSHTLIDDSSIPPFIVKLHNYMQTVGANPEISIMAFIADCIQSNIKWK